MIVASDLDRTLMYSNRALEELGRPEKADLHPVEMKDGNWIGYMTEAAFSALKQLNSHCLFVPVTTRTTEQFKRFVIFEKEIPLSYAITSNGAHVLYKGEPINEWEEQLVTRMKNESVSQKEILNALKVEGFHLEGQRKQAEKLFFYYILNGLPPEQELLAIRRFASEYGWRTSRQGRKLYFIPKAISKGNALTYISNRVGMETIAGAGDSTLDWDFLKNCRYRFVPSHGELRHEKGTNQFTLTNQLGIAAGEEILQHLLMTLSLKI